MQISDCFFFFSQLHMAVLTVSRTWNYCTLYVWVMLTSIWDTSVYLACIGQKVRDLSIALMSVSGLLTQVLLLHVIDIHMNALQKSCRCSYLHWLFWDNIVGIPFALWKGHPSSSSTLRPEPLWGKDPRLSIGAISAKWAVEAPRWQTLCVCLVKRNIVAWEESNPICAWHQGSLLASKCVGWLLSSVADTGLLSACHSTDGGVEHCCSGLLCNCYALGS